MIRDVTTPAYTDAAFIAEVHAWARETCERLGLEISGPIEQPHIRPWSTVFRVPTASGAVYLKVCGPSQAHEPRLTKLLQREFPTLVPEVLALHPTHDWMVVAEGGKKLREVFSPEQMLDEWARILPRYAELQLALAPHVDEMLGLGAPDQRLSRLALDLAAVIDDERVLRFDEPDGLTRDDLPRLRALLPRISAEIETLAALGLPDSVQHDDLHDGNVLVGGDRRVIFDWGDANVSHPFLTLTIVLRVAAFRVSRPESTPEIRRLRDAYLEPFGRLAPPALLRDAADRGVRLGTLSRALTWYVVVTRIESALSAEPYAVSGSLQRVLEAFV